MSCGGIKDNEISKCLDDEEGSEDEDASDWEPESSKPSTKMSSKKKKKVGRPLKSTFKNHKNEHREIEGKKMKGSSTEQYENMKRRISRGLGSQNLSTNSDETKYDLGMKAASKKKKVRGKTSSEESRSSTMWKTVKVPMKFGERNHKILLRRNNQLDVNHRSTSSDSDSDCESKASERKNGRSERKRKALTEDSEATTSKVRHVSTHENVDEERKFHVSKNLAETKSTSSNDAYFQRNLRSPPKSPAVKNLFPEKNSNKLNNCRTPTKLTEEDLSNKENKSLCSEQSKGDSTPRKIGTRQSLFEEGYNSESQVREKSTPLKQAQTPTKENKNSSRKQEQNTTPRKNEGDLRDLKESQILNELSPTKSRCENLSPYKRPTKSVSKTLNEESNETVTDTGTPTKTQTAELKRLNIDCNPSMINAASPVRQSRSSYNTRTPLKNSIGGENEVKSPKKISLKLKRFVSDNDSEDNSITKIKERTETPSSSKKLNRASKLSSNEIEDINSTSRTPEKSKIVREMKRLAIDCEPAMFAASPVRQRRASGSRTATPQKSKISDSLKTPKKCSEDLSDDAECVTPRGKDKVATMTPRSKALKFEYRNQSTMSPFPRQSVTVTTPVSKKKSGRGFLTPSMAKKEHVRKEIKDDDLDTTRKQLHISTVPKSLPCRDAEFDQIKSFLIRKIEHSSGGSTRNFNSPFTLITLYKSLVRPLLEYGSIIWSPFQKNHVSQLESIQTRFIRMLGPRLGFTYRTTPVDDVEKSFGLLPLSLRRHHADIFMLYKLVNGFVDCPNILSGIDITTPRGTRSRTIFSRRFLPAYYSYNSGISRLLKAGSTAAAQLDFFGEKPLRFKKKVSLIT
ncbi:nucleolar and coiled-body phosphoprotein 1-like [Macrosteles quadrilineatus]|uniref:nucleolar and coiled-body phosphoprotein 1-like n=1 Tax=Macrosteles quadrilineatus TaxID=74068 RepID=UPI0023E2C69D|nr:nucleolar and coiled-body phosphoprotein 1-like [Macrosteles quadrilineatus]